MLRTDEARHARVAAGHRARVAKALRYLAAFSAFLGNTGAASGRPWTAVELTEVRQITSTAIAQNGLHAAYVTSEPSVAKDRVSYVLHLIDLPSGRETARKEALYLSHLSFDPISRSWLVLGDLGDGVQLYSFDEAGRGHVRVRVAPVLAGGGYDSTYPLPSTTDYARPTGVVDYGISKDGSRLWYSTILPSKSSETDGPGLDIRPFERTTEAIRAAAFGGLQLRVVAGGRDRAVASISSTEPRQTQLAFRSDIKSVLWRSDGKLEFQIPSNGSGSPDWIVHVYDPATGKETSEPRDASESVELVPIKSTITSEVRNGVPHLIRVETSKAGETDLGRSDFKVAQSISVERPRLGLTSDIAIGSDKDGDGLVRIRSNGTIVRLAPAFDLGGCAFAEQEDRAICVRQSQQLAPEVVLVRGLDVSLIARPNARLDGHGLLKIAHRTWRNAEGILSNGLIFYPSDYQRGKIYPAVFITHGNDARNKFADIGFQWNYPVQLLVEAGFVVVGFNEGSEQTPAMERAWSAWSLGTHDVSPTDMQLWIYDQVVDSLRVAVRTLQTEGLISQRIGIAGYSRGSQIVNVAMSHSNLFLAGSSGDGGYGEPASYWASDYTRDTYVALFGGSPYDLKAESRYAALSPTFRAKLFSGPLLQQVASSSSSKTELHSALSEAGIPSVLTLYPGETHGFHGPLDRAYAMDENLAWFETWLLTTGDHQATIADFRRAISQLWGRR